MLARLFQGLKNLQPSNHDLLKVLGSQSNPANKEPLNRVASLQTKSLTFSARSKAAQVDLGLPTAPVGYLMLQNTDSRPASA